MPCKYLFVSNASRLGFSVEMGAKPDVLLLDEIFGVGDHCFKQKSVKAMRERLSGGQTVILVSHDPNTLNDVCDRAIFIEAGQVRQEGSVDDVNGVYLKR